LQKRQEVALSNDELEVTWCRWMEEQGRHDEILLRMLRLDFQQLNENVRIQELRKRVSKWEYERERERERERENDLFLWQFCWSEWDLWEWRSRVRQWQWRKLEGEVLQYADQTKSTTLHKSTDQPTLLLTKSKKINVHIISFFDHVIMCVIVIVYKKLPASNAAVYLALMSLRSCLFLPNHTTGKVLRVVSVIPRNPPIKQQQQQSVQQQNKKLSSFICFS
jgi:hypothetical protein